MQIISFVLNALLGGGFFITLATLKSSRKKANAEAQQAEATNANSILETNQKYIVEPLTHKINALEKTIKGLTRALNRISDCPHSADCPVRVELQKQQDT